MVLLNFHLTIQVLHGTWALLCSTSCRENQTNQNERLKWRQMHLHFLLSWVAVYIGPFSEIPRPYWAIATISVLSNVSGCWTGQLPVSLILISIGWWENHVDKGAPVGKFSLLFSAIRGMFRYPLNLFSRFYQVFGSNQRKHERDETIYSDICQPVEIIGFCRHDAYFSGRGFHDARRTCVWCYLWPLPFGYQKRFHPVR